MLVCLCCVLFGCTQNPEIPTSESEQEKQFNTISSLAYIGGSVVYNPTNSAVAQLNTGAIIAVYHGRVIPKNVVAQIYKNGKVISKVTLLSFLHLILNLDKFLFVLIQNQLNLQIEYYFLIYLLKELSLLNYMRKIQKDFQEAKMNLMQHAIYLLMLVFQSY